jgi:hypothetical protein
VPITVNAVIAMNVYGCRERMHHLNLKLFESAKLSEMLLAFGCEFYDCKQFSIRPSSGALRLLPNEFWAPRKLLSGLDSGEIVAMITQ